jgi:hypothetical protein
MGRTKWQLLPLHTGGRQCYPLLPRNHTRACWSIRGAVEEVARHRAADIDVDGIECRNATGKVRGLQRGV